MCTAILYKNGNSYFGRNLDLERGYGERVVITPRRCDFKFRQATNIDMHYAMIGMAAIVDDFPLYYEATNEKGLSIAGLSFPENTVYSEYESTKTNIASFEFIPWVLCQCSTLTEAKKLIEKTNLTCISFNGALPASPLHWMISDRKHSIVIESLTEGIGIYENPFDVLTNNPPFEYHRINASNYMNLQAGAVKNALCKDIPLKNYSFGMGAIGLPGDFSSASRFIRAMFVKENSVADSNEQSSVNQFFHILKSVAMPKGCVSTENGFEYTRYSSCCNADNGIYYYTTYNNPTVNSISMHKENLEQSKLIEYTVTGLE